MNTALGNESDPETLRAAVRSTAAFVYDNSHWLTVVSVAWSLASVFIVTIGPATLGAYVAILGLDSDRNRIDTGRIVSICRQQIIPAVAFGLLPPIFIGISVGYFFVLSASQTLVRTAAFLATLYGGIYLALVMIPTFVALAHGQPGVDALWTGVRWTADHPTLTLYIGILTLIVFLVTVLLTVGFVLLFPTLAFSLHVKLVGEDVA